MSITPGNVSVDDSGNVTYTPDDDTNAAKSLYLLLLADQESSETPQTTVTPPVVTIDPVTFVPTVVSPGSVTTINVPVTVGPDAKKAQAKMANTMASWIITYLKTQAIVTGTINDDKLIDGIIK